MNLLITMNNDINKRFDESDRMWDKLFDEWDKKLDKRAEMMNKHFDNMNKGFDELHIELNKTKDIMSKGCNTIKNANDKPDEKQEESRGEENQRE